MFECLVCHDGFQHAGGAKGVTEIAFQAVHGDVLQVGAADGHRFHIVVVECGGTMRIDECQLRLVEACRRFLDGAQEAFACAGGAGYVVGVVVDGSGAQYQCIVRYVCGIVVDGIDDGGCRLA